MKKINKLLILLSLTLLIAACGGEKEAEKVSNKETDSKETQETNKDCEIQSFVASYNDTVILGNKLQVVLSLKNNCEKLNLRYTLNGKILKVDENNNGVMDLRASASGGERLDENLFSKEFKAEVSFKNPKTGVDTLIAQTQKYFIKVPKLIVEGADDMILKKRVENCIKITVEGIEEGSKPVFRVSGGSYKAGENDGELCITPRSVNVTIIVSDRGMNLGKLEFKIK